MIRLFLRKNSSTIRWASFCHSLYMEWPSTANWPCWPYPDIFGRTCRAFAGFGAGDLRVKTELVENEKNSPKLIRFLLLLGTSASLLVTSALLVVTIRI